MYAERNPYTESIWAKSDVCFTAVVISWCCFIDETIRVKHLINEDVQYVKIAFTSALMERPQESVNQTLRARMENPTPFYFYINSSAVRLLL